VYAVDGDFVMDLLYEDHVLPLMRRREIPEIILVGIGYGDINGFEFAKLRTRDYTPTQRFDEVETGHAPAFLEFVTGMIVPFIDATYRTEPGERCIAGHSLGGLFSFYATLSRPDVFNRAIASSPSFHWGLRGVFELEEKIASERDDWNSSLYMSVGLREANTMHVNYNDMIDVLHGRMYRSLRMHHEMHDGKDHGDAVQPAAVNGLKFVFQQG
jgi:predicted alpha/beta superfamily hydrolase